MAKSCVVVGGGVSGLTSALALAEAGYQVDLYESKEKLGGLIRTEVTELGKAEAAANGILNSAAVEGLLRRLKVPFSGILPTAKSRYVYVNGQPQRWPFSAWESLAFASRLVGYLLRGKASMAPQPGETIAKWLDRTLGTVVNDKFLAPALLGIYASRSSELSASLVMSPFFGPKKKTAKPQVRGTVAPLGGMGALINGLEKSCREVGVNIHFNHQYQWERWDDGKTPHVVATSVEHSARLLKSVAPEAASQLSRVRMLPVISATLFYPKEAQFLTGFGCLFSEAEKMKALGVLFPTQIFPERSQVYAETWIMGGAVRPEVVNHSPDQILQDIKEDRLKLTPKEVEPLDRCLFRWPKALPYYDLYLEEILKDFRLPKGLFLNGNYLGKIGLAGMIERGLEMPDIIASGARA